MVVSSAIAQPVKTRPEARGPWVSNDFHLVAMHSEVSGGIQDFCTNLDAHLYMIGRESAASSSARYKCDM